MLTRYQWFNRSYSIFSCLTKQATKCNDWSQTGEIHEKEWRYALGMYSMQEIWNVKWFFPLQVIDKTTKYSTRSDQSWGFTHSANHILIRCVIYHVYSIWKCIPLMVVVIFVPFLPSVFVYFFQFVPKFLCRDWWRINLVLCIPISWKTFDSMCVRV